MLIIRQKAEMLCLVKKMREMHRELKRFKEGNNHVSQMVANNQVIVEEEDVMTPTNLQGTIELQERREPPMVEVQLDPCTETDEENFSQIAC